MIEILSIIGFPSFYGGAGAELDHQIPVWEKLGVKLHFIPTQKNVRGVALYNEMLERGHLIHEAYDWNAIPENAPVISFCNEDFLTALPEISQRTRSTLNALWFTHWDPTQPIATRPLSIRKNATWYTYGHDLTKNVTELYNTNGTIATAYDYTPYGAVTATGIDQPFQWSSEVYDIELGMVYYNYRHYNPLDGRWIGRDLINRTDYVYCTNSPYGFYDLLGLVGIMCGPPNSSNCLGGAITNQINQSRQPNSAQDPDKNMIEAMEKEGWKCDEVKETSKCNCECDDEKILITLYKNTYPGNKEKDPWKDPSFDWNKRDPNTGEYYTDFHAIRGLNGCSPKYKNIHHYSPNPQEFDEEIQWELFNKNPLLCCCKAKKK